MPAKCLCSVEVDASTDHECASTCIIIILMLLSFHHSYMSEAQQHNNIATVTHSPIYCKGLLSNVIKDLEQSLRDAW